MRSLFALLLLTTAAFAQTPAAQLAADDAVRIREFYRLASQIQNQIWPDWSRTPAPLLLVTPDTEFLMHRAEPPEGFKRVEDDLYARPRQFPTNLLAAFPAFGPPSVIVIGEPKNTTSKTSTPWLITLMHEHYHQLQNAHPRYYQAVQDLGLSHGDNTGMWMLNYPFPYEKPDVAQSFASLRDLLLSAVNETEKEKFATLAKQYIRERQKFFARLSSDDHKYLSFQLWQEGIARYTEIKAAEAAAQYQPTAEYAASPTSSRSRTMPQRLEPKPSTNSGEPTSPSRSGLPSTHSAPPKVCCSTDSTRSGRTGILSTCCQRIRSSKNDGLFLKATCPDRMHVDRSGGRRIAVHATHCLHDLMS